jgi:hypothetical protein
MKKKILATFLILCITQYSSIAQSSNAAGSATSEKEVKQVIQNMFHAMQQADTSLLKTCFSDKVIFQTIFNFKAYKIWVVEVVVPVKMVLQEVVKVMAIVPAEVATV